MAAATNDLIRFLKKGGSMTAKYSTHTVEVSGKSWCREVHCAMRLGDATPQFIERLREAGLAEWLDGADENDEIQLGPGRVLPGAAMAYGPDNTVPIAEVVRLTKEHSSNATQRRQYAREEQEWREREAAEQREREQREASSRQQETALQAANLKNPAYLLKLLQQRKPL